MSWNPNNICHLLQHQFLENSHMYGIPDDDLEKKLALLIFCYIFEFFVIRGVCCMKKKHAWKYVFCPKVWHFLSFFFDISGQVMHWCCWILRSLDFRLSQLSKLIYIFNKTNNSNAHLFCPLLIFSLIAWHNRQWRLKSMEVMCDVIQSLLRKAFKIKKNWKLSINATHPYTGLMYFFSNTGHKDNNYMTVDDSKSVHEYVDEYPRNDQKEYVSCFKMHFLIISWSILCLKLVVGCKWMSPMITGITCIASYFWTFVLLMTCHMAFSQMISIGFVLYFMDPSSIIQIVGHYG